MKRLLAVVAVALLALSATGCVVTAVYPFYSDATLRFDPALVGKWQDSDGRTTWTFAKEGEKAYRVTVTEPKPGAAGDKGEMETRSYLVHLFHFGGNRFLDAFPTDAPDITVGTHFLAKMELQDGTMALRGLDPDAVARVAGVNGPLHVHPASDGTVAENATNTGAPTLFLAPTARLQAFVEQHQAEIFEKDGGSMKRVGTDAVSR